MELPLLVDTRFQELFHSPLRGAFHLSLAVLVHYRSVGSIQAYEMVLADSDRISRVPPYLGYPPAQTPVSSTGLSPCAVGLSMPVRLQESGAFRGPATPAQFLEPVWPVPLSLATTEGITVVFFSSGY